MYIIKHKYLISIFLFLFSTNKLLASELTFSIKAQCELYLDEKLDKVSGRLNQIIQGYGNVQVLKLSDILASLTGDILDEARDFVRLSSPHQEAIVVFLPKTATHYFQFSASTYLDNGETFLKLSNDGKWFAVDLIGPDTTKAIHFVVFEHDATRFAFFHELSHLIDIEMLYRLATRLINDFNHRLIIRADIFRIATELKAYKKDYREFRKAKPQLASEYAKFLAEMMSQDFGKLIQDLPTQDFVKIKKLFNLNSHKVDDLVLFLENDIDVPDFDVALSAFDSNVLKVVNK